jgi:pyruvate/2-oxoglutarate dehydrogenase complex dihydrolipoamide acyltransferase (E2) component
METAGAGEDVNAPVSCVPVTMPQIVEDEDRYLVVQWLARDGDEVEQGELLVAIETAKARQDLESPRRGWLHDLVAVDTECVTGQVLARISAQQVCPRCKPVR